MTAIIETKLKEAGINTTGSGASFPSVIKNAIDTVNSFGYEYWLQRTTMGVKIKNIVKELSKNG